LVLNVDLLADGANLDAILTQPDTSIPYTTKSANNYSWYPLNPGQYSLVTDFTLADKLVSKDTTLVEIQAIDSLDVSDGLSKWMMVAYLPGSNDGSFFVWNPDNTSLTQQYTEVVPGAIYDRWQGGWAYVTIDLKGNASADTTTYDIKLPLNQNGWFQLANPYPYPISIPKTLEGRMYGWDRISSDYVVAKDQMDPWIAYWVRLDGLEQQPEFSKVIAPKPMQAASRIIQPNAWQLQLNAAGFSDELNFISWGEEDVVKSELPSGPNQEIGLSIIGNEGYLQEQQLSMDGSLEWRFRVFAQKSGINKGILTLDKGLLNKPSEAKFYLFDGNSWSLFDQEKEISLSEKGKTYNLRLTQNKPLNPGTFELSFIEGQFLVQAEGLQSIQIVDSRGKVYWENSKNLTNSNILPILTHKETLWVQVNVDGEWSAKRLNY
jgi:hypothetical protein